MSACEEQHVLIINMLIDNGAHVNQQTEVSYVLYTYFVTTDRHAIYTIQHIPCDIDVLFNTSTYRIGR